MSQFSFDFAIAPASTLASSAGTGALPVGRGIAMRPAGAGATAPGLWRRVARAARLALRERPVDLDHPADASARGRSDHAADAQGFERIGFEIGWDHAHHRLAPPVEHLSPGHPVRQGWEAGMASFGARTLRASPWVRTWLNLRLAAFNRGIAFDALHVTPHLLQRLHVSHCPITREALTHGLGADSDASIDRVDPARGYGPGNLAVMSALAQQARRVGGFRDAIETVERIEADRSGTVEGLNAAEWARVAVLASFTTPLPHDEAARLPLLVLPPARLQVVNPAQGLQLLLTTLLMRPGYARRLAEIAGRTPSPAARRALQVFMHTLLARRVALGHGLDAQALRNGLEDAWRHPLVNQRWQAFALQMSPAAIERMLEQTLGRGPGEVGLAWVQRDAG
jgi:hypothetical protein